MTMIRSAPAVRVCLVALLAACSDDAGPSSAAGPSSRESRHVALARGRVDVQGGLIRITSPRAGLLAKWQVAVGDVVTAGQVLAVLDLQDAEAAVARASAELRLLEAEGHSRGSRLPAARERAQRLAEAAAAGATSGQAAEDARHTVAEIEAEQEVHAASLDLARQKLAQAIRGVDQSSLRAPADGRITQRLVAAGTSIDAHAPLLQILPKAPLVVHAELREAHVPRIKLGMRAEVVPAGSESALQLAEVTRIDDVFGASRESEDGQSPGDARVLECELRLLPVDAPVFRVGQRVLVRFLP